MSNDNRCEFCGRSIPEGMMICESCKQKCIADFDAERKRSDTLERLAWRAVGFVAGVIVTSLLLTALKSFAVTPRVLPMPPDVADIPMAAITEPIQPSQDALHGDYAEDVRLYRITAYCPCALCCGDSADGVTATGAIATAGRTVAVDPDVIPLGSTVVIGGHEYIAEDVGGAIKGDEVDVYFCDHDDALAFGVKYEEVTVK